MKIQIITMWKEQHIRNCGKYGKVDYRNRENEGYEYEGGENFLTGNTSCGWMRAGSYRIEKIRGWSGGKAEMREGTNHLGNTGWSIGLDERICENVG